MDQETEQVIEFIKHLNIPELQAKLIIYANECEKLGLEYASALSIYEQLEDFDKIIYSKLFVHQVGSVAMRDSNVRASEDWLKHTLGKCAAREKKETSKVKYTACQNKFEAIRSILSTRKEELKRGL